MPQYLTVDLETEVLAPLTATQALYNTRLKYFGDEYTKVACFSKPIFNPHGMEKRKKDIRVKESYAQDKNAEVRSDSIKRAKDKVFEICYANDFRYFITLTLNSEKVQRDNKTEIVKALNEWLHNRVRYSGLVYVLLPEYHKDGKSIHFHGLCKGSLPLTDSGTVLVSGVKKPMKKALAEKRGLTGRTVYNLDNWDLGFSTVIELDAQKERTAIYVTKYITKENHKITGRFYYSGGKGLIRQVPTEYRNYPYCDFEAEEKTILDGVLAVKYKTI